MHLEHPGVDSVMDSDLQSLQEVRDLVRKAAQAQARFATATQGEVDKICLAMVRAGERESRRLAELAVEETGMGRADDKMLKHELSTRVLWERYAGMTTVGAVKTDRRNKVTTLAVPMGVIAAIIPTTNPTSTAMYKSILCVKSRNGMVASPHPNAGRCTYETIRVMTQAAVAAGAPENLIACISMPSIDAATALMKHPQIGLILSTGGSAIVRAAHSTGKPAIGVGPGNVPAFIERSADVRRAVKDIILGKCFDWGLVCSSEQAMIVEQPIEKKVTDYLKDEKVYWVRDDERVRLEEFMVMPDGRLNTAVVGQPPVRIAQMAGFTVPEETRVLMVKQSGVGADYPLSREKLSPVLAYYTVPDARSGIELATAIVNFGGVGHTASIHTKNEQVVEQYAASVRTFRILVNTPSPHGSVGFTTGLDPAMTLGSGTWGGAITGDNITPLHLVNLKRIAWSLHSVEAGGNGEFQSKRGNYSRYDEAPSKKPATDSETGKSSGSTAELTPDEASHIARNFAQQMEQGQE